MNQWINVIYNKNTHRLWYLRYLYSDMDETNRVRILATHSKCTGTPANLPGTKFTSKIRGWEIIVFVTKNVEAMGSGVSVANEGDVVKDIEEVSRTDVCALYYCIHEIKDINTHTHTHTHTHAHTHDFT